MQTLRGLWWNRHFRRWIVAAVLLAHMVGGRIRSYEPESGLVFEYQGAGTCRWQANNTLELINRPLRHDQSAERFVYDPQTDRLTSRGSLPALYSPINAFSRVFPLPHSYTDDGTGDTHTIMSPDGRYTLYYRESWPTHLGRQYFSVVLADGRTATSTVIIELASSPYKLSVYWNLTSNAFIFIKLPEYGGDPIVQSVSGFDRGLDHLQVKQVSGYNEVAFDWTLEQVFDIDSTGRYLLAEGYFSQPDDAPEEQRLLLIDTQDLSYEVVARATYFIAARFEQPGDQRVFYVSSRSAFVYDRQTRAREILNRSVQALDIDYGFGDDWDHGCTPAISPDGRFLAYDSRGDEKWGVSEDEVVYVWPIQGTD